MVVPGVLSSGSSGSKERELLQECEYHEEMLGTQVVTEHGVELPVSHSKSHWLSVLHMVMFYFTYGKVLFYIW